MKNKDINDKRPNVATASILILGAYAISVNPALAQNSRADNDGGVTQLEEITVTATRRETALATTPLAISAVSSETIDKQNISSMADLAGAITGLSIVDQGPGLTRPVIRGLQGVGDAQVGIYIDNTPITGSPGTANSAGRFSPEIKPIDIQRVEVLRGPQGTLYGGGAMGGAVRYISNKPDSQEFSGQFSIGAKTYESSMGYEGHLVLNLPIIEDKFAARIVSYTRDDEGYIDNPTIGVNDTNDVETQGGRLMLGWTPTDKIELLATYYFEEQNSDSQSVIREDLSGYQNTRFGLEPIDDEISILNLTANMETSWVDLVYSFSSYDRDLFYRFNIDVNLFSANPTNGGAALIQPQDVDTDVHELRFVSNADGPLKWTTGIFLSERNTFGLSEVYYRNESGDLINLSGGPGSEGDPASIAFRRSVDQKQTERAIYGEVSYDFTDNTTLTFGARIFEFENDDGGAALVSPVGIPANAPFIGASSEHDGEVFKLKLSHNILDDSVVYLNWSQGFRAGGANVEALTSGFPIADTPETFEPDTVDNYEIGFRGALMDGRLTLATALFYLDWQDMFVDLERNDLLGNIEFRANAGEAEITGLEFETEVLLAEDFKVSASFTVIDGELASDVRQFGDSAGALAGDTLPFQPDMTFNLSAEYGWAMANLRSYIWAGYRYVGESSTDFHPFVIDSNGPTTTPNPEYTEVGDYGILSLRYGLEGDDWNGAFYIDNATDERECTFIRITGLRPPPGNCFVERPLTAGIRFSKDF